MRLYALDSDYRLVTASVPYTNLQWRRRYYQAGEFSVQVPLSQYSPSWAFLGSPDRPELGMVQKVQASGGSEPFVQLGGFFAEKILDEKACYPRYTGSSQTAEGAVRAVFEAFRDDLPVRLAEANDPMLGSRVQSDFSDPPLGQKLYSILESQGLSLRVGYDFEADELSLSVWSGADRTQSQSSNAWQTFSTLFGNVASSEVNMDTSAWRNYAIVPCNADDAGRERQTLYLDLSGGGYRREVVIDMRGSKPEDGQEQADFEAAVLQEAAEAMTAYLPIEDADITAAGGVGYLSDYDLGDVCDLVLAELGVRLEARIVGVDEVFKAQGNSTTLLFGNKKIR